MQKPNTFTELGIDFDNNRFGFGISSEIEKDGVDYRQPGFIKMRLASLYLRIWIMKTVFILDFPGGWKIKHPKRNNFKVVVGLSGYKI